MEDISESHPQQSLVLSVKRWTSSSSLPSRGDLIAEQGNMFEFNTIPANELSAQQVRCWSDIQLRDARFRSPFLHPGFTLALAAVRDDIQVLVLREQGNDVGFLAYETCGQIARPAGFPMSSSHGVVTSATGWQAADILAATGKKALRFDQWISDQVELESASAIQAACASIDLRNGFDSYLKGKRETGSKLYSETSRLRRKLSREVGEVRCVLSSDTDALGRLLAWKSAQCERTNVADLFAFPWSGELLRRLLENTADEFRGMLWELHAGDQPVAVNFVLRSRHVAQGWFMAFDETYRKFSPGMILMHDILRDCERLGITDFELGKGQTSFKQRLMTHKTFVMEGSVDRRLAAQAAWSGWLVTRNWLRTSRLRGTAHRVDRMLTDARRAFGGKC